MSIIPSKVHRLGATPEPRKVININDENFDDVVNHFGQRIFQLGAVASVNKPPTVNGHIITPVTLTQVPYPNASAPEIIAQQRSFTGRIPPLVKGVILAWAIFNLTGILLALFGMI